jgi:biopolymer transport protein ExbD
VELPVSRNAVAAPGADDAGALVVSISEDGQVYVGVTPIGPADLPETLSSEKGKTLYMKGDARVAYEKVVDVLAKLPTAGFGKVSVLTSQRESREPGKLVHPKALEVLLGARAPAGAESADVELLQSGQGRPTVKIDNERVPWDALASALRGRAAVVRAEGTVPFGDVVKVIDVCRATGALVVLRTPATP